MAVLQLLSDSAYIYGVGQPTMAINGVFTSLTGPGGQHSRASTKFRRAEVRAAPIWGRNRIDGV